MLREHLYAAYTWRVRHFKEGETNETTIRFTPDGRPYGFVEKLRRTRPGRRSTPAAARRIAEDGAAARWKVDLSQFRWSNRDRNGGRAAASTTRSPTSAPTPTLNEGRYRLRLVVSGDRLTEVTHFIKIPEAFTRRYASMRSANESIGIGSAVGMVLLYVVGGIGVGLFFMMRQRYVLWRQAAMWGVAVGGLQALAGAQRVPADLDGLRHGDPARRRSSRSSSRSSCASFVGFSVFFGAVVHGGGNAVAPGVRPSPAVLARLGEGARRLDPGPRPAPSAATCSCRCSSPTTSCSTCSMTQLFGWWSPAEALMHPDVLATYAPWLSAIANSFQAGFWEEALFRAVPHRGRGAHRRSLRQTQAVHRRSPSSCRRSSSAPARAVSDQPSYARPVELILPSIGFGLLYLYFGLLPGIVLHFAFDVVWFALPIFLAKAPGIWFQQLMVVAPDARAAVDRALAPDAGWPMDGTVAGRSERRVDAAARTAERRPSAGVPQHPSPAVRARPGSRSAASRLPWRSRPVVRQTTNPYGRSRSPRHRKPPRAQELQQRGVTLAAALARHADP